jgi:hypothetical protein
MARAWDDSSAHAFMHSKKLASVQSSTTVHQGEQAGSKPSPQLMSEHAIPMEAAINALEAFRLVAVPSARRVAILVGTGFWIIASATMNDARITPPYSSTQLPA